MSNHQRAQRLLAQTMQVEHSKKMQPRLRVVVAETLSKTASFESMMTQPLFANSELVVSGRMGLEGMQQMQVAEAAKKANAEQWPPGDAQPTAASVYVVSPLDVLKGRDGARRALNDAIQDSLVGGEKVVVSLLPVNLEPPAAEEQYFLDSAELAVQRTLNKTGVPMCNSLEALTRYFNA